jgi:glycosyltransferase involved in cell wall biosynthesis
LNEASGKKTWGKQLSYSITQETVSQQGEPVAFDKERQPPKEQRPLRVLIVGPSLDILGGQAVQAARLLAELKTEPSIEVSFLPINPRLPGLLRKLQAIKYLRTIVTSLLYCATLLARVRSYDVIHIFSASYLSFLIAPTPAILVSKLYRKKILLNYHSGEAEDHLRRSKTALRIINMVDEIAVPSSYLVAVFSKFGLKGRAIYNLVDTNLLRFRERAPLRPVFLSNRNLEPMYNVGCVLRAFQIIQQYCPEASLTIAGDGRQRRMLEALAGELGLVNVSFTGRVPPDKMPALYEKADIFLNASEIDNMPLSLIESFAAGLLVVTSNAGGIPHIVSNEKTGLVVECGDFQSMAEASLRLLKDERLASKIARNAREECDKYRWASVRSEWLKLYHQLACLTERPKDELSTVAGR